MCPTFSANVCVQNVNSCRTKGSIADGSYVHPQLCQIECEKPVPILLGSKYTKMPTVLANETRFSDFDREN